jgi:hypothetical protein
MKCARPRCERPALWSTARTENPRCYECWLADSKVKASEKDRDEAEAPNWFTL